MWCCSCGYAPTVFCDFPIVWLFRFRERVKEMSNETHTRQENRSQIPNSKSSRAQHGTKSQNPNSKY
jgi:hypothetical protein